MLMRLQQGYNPFIIAVSLMLIGLVIAWIASLKMDISNSKKYVRVGNTVAMIGIIFGFQLRLWEFAYGESYWGRTDNLPGPQTILLIAGIYVALLFICTDYTQYRKNPNNELNLQLLIKNIIYNNIVLASIFTAVILMECL